jgi:hypothetical protein
MLALTCFVAILFAAPSIATAQGAGQATDQLAPLPVALPWTHKPHPTEPAISVEDLETRLYIFADDSMEGRGAGSVGDVKATDYLAAEVKRIGLQPVGDSGTYFQSVPADQGNQSSYPMRNIVAVLPGSDPVLRHQYVVLGAHSDHLGTGNSAFDHDSLRVYNHFMRPQGGVNAALESMKMGSIKQPTDDDWRAINAELAKLRKLHPPRQDSIYNGADDDGTGSVALLEIAQALAASPTRPKRSILFVWHTDEEGNMSGSRHLVGHPPVPLDSIVVLLTLDMIGRGGASDRVGGGPRFLQVIKAGCLSTALDTLLNDVNQRSKHNLQLSEGHESRSINGLTMTASSDYASYAVKGIPYAFFFTDMHPDYHQVTDEPQYIDYEHLARVTNFVQDVTVQMANAAPHAICRRSAPSP